MQYLKTAIAILWISTTFANTECTVTEGFESSDPPRKILHDFTIRTTEFFKPIRLRSHYKETVTIKISLRNSQEAKSSNFRPLFEFNLFHGISPIPGGGLIRHVPSGLDRHKSGHKLR